MNAVVAYAKAIECGEIVTSRRVAKVYKNLKERIVNPSGKFIFDEVKAKRAIDFIEKFCKHSKGKWAGKPVILELFQKAYISALFGFVERDTGIRQYQESLFMVGRKNGKSTMLAGIALYMLVADGEAGAEIYSVATKKDQAKLIFDETYNMVKQSKSLNKVIRKRKSDLYFTKGLAKIQALGSKSDTLDGLNSHLVIMDELHGIKDRNLYEVMKQSISSREQPLLVMITTAGTVRENIFDDIYHYACNVVDGNFDDEQFLGIIYELDRREEWEDPSKWIKANPGLGTIKKISYIENQVKRAGNSDNDLKGILVKDFNVRETTSGAWLSLDVIENAETFDIRSFQNYYAIGGVDLSRTTDLTCATILLIDKKSEKRYVHQMYWLPEENFHQRVESEKIPYDKWYERGLLRLCQGNRINYSDVTAWFLEIVHDYLITPVWIYYDPYSASYWVEEMESNGFPMVKCYQGAKTLSTPMQILGADLEAKKINYNNNPILKWCLSNTTIQVDRNANIVPRKALSPKMRIDGTASLLDAYVGLVEHYNEFKEVQPDDNE
ncbi:terminase large subunit [Tuanshanicoccus lijuaniae]|uniref:terminase large subunit n=1 Tax=Aerococcaceae bacterium zg-1292 TaxID=2774330 RepID=UPI001935FDEE|nr:terminase large subunit [Aerococcaceae bacterium zg-1292]QQA37534.1 terminase large subunit [Aerococcaceae bacterium zg-1292]